MKHLRKIFSTETKSLADERALLVTISTPTPDRVGDVVVPQGAKLANYQRNPVVLLFHDYQKFPIGKATDIQVSENAITAKVVFAEEGTSPEADIAYNLYKQGIMNAWSIGFAPNMEKATSIAEGGWKFNEWELLEFSAVPVPANPDALTMMRSKGLKAVETMEDVELEDEEYTETVDAQAEPEGEEAADPQVAEEVVIDEEQKTLTVTTAYGTVDYKLTDDVLAHLKTPAVAEPEIEPEPQPEPQEKYIELTYETLKIADQEIGRALRDLKQFLPQRNTPKQA